MSFFTSYLHNRSQRVVLNGIESEWKNIEAGVPQGSVLGPLLFLVYINDLPENILSNMKLFADDSSLFTRVTSVNDTQHLLEKDLETVSKWGHQWKMVFNPDLSKQAVEVIFSCKRDKVEHPSLHFNGIPVARVPFTKHLGLFLDEKLSFIKHTKEKISKAMKGIALLKFLSKFVTTDVLNMSYKLYIRPHLDYGDIIYHGQSAEMMVFLEQIQYKAALVITGCWQGTNRDKLYNDLGWESLTDRRWYRRLCMFFKIRNHETPRYLYDHLPPPRDLIYNLRNSRNYSVPHSRTSRFDNSFFPYCIKEWENLSDEIKISASLAEFKRKIISFIRPQGHPIFGILDIKGTRILNKLRVGFSDLRSHRYSHNFDCLSPSRGRNQGCEDNVHFFLCCPHYRSIRISLLGNISQILGNDISVLPDQYTIGIILNGSNVYNKITNRLILSETIEYIRKSRRFVEIEAFNA